MGLIAFLNQNITIGCLWGTFSVLLTTVEAHFDVGRQFSVLGAAGSNLATALCAPLAGVLATRFSLRLVMLVGSLSSVAGYVILATTHTYPLYLTAYALFLGPGMATVGVVLPATLVTRWFTFNRGRALGLVTVPLAVAIAPLATTALLKSQGISVTYGVLAGLSAICLLANFFVIDHPPQSDPASATASSGSASVASHGDEIAGHGHGAPQAAGGATMLQLLRLPRFWAISLAAVAPITGAVILAAHMVPMAQSWGLTATLGATLLTVQSIAGIPGTVIFGWIADRIGSVLTLSLIIFDCAVLWLLLLIQPPFVVTAAIAGLLGLHVAGSLPVLSSTLAELFGRESFSRAYGIFNLINLPFSVLCVPLVALLYARTGSYSNAILVQATFLVISVPLALSVRRLAPNAQPRAQ